MKIEHRDDTLKDYSLPIPDLLPNREDFQPQFVFASEDHPNTANPCWCSCGLHGWLVIKRSWVQFLLPLSLVWEYRF